jgi:hypothetical protein
MSDTEFGVLRGLQEGIPGLYPYVFFDMNEVNLLNPNQSSAGDAKNDASGFTGMASVTPSRATAVTASQGRGYISYVSPASGAAGTAGVIVGHSLLVTADVLVPGRAVPVKPSQSYTFQVMVRTLAGTAASWRATVAFYDSAGAIIGSATNGTAATVTSSWVARTVSATSPATAAYAILSITNNATLSASNTIGIDAMSFQEGNAAVTWQLGLGVPYIGPIDIDDTYPWLPYHGPVSVTLMEL